MKIALTACDFFKLTGNQDFNGEWKGLEITDNQFVICEMEPDTYKKLQKVLAKEKNIAEAWKDGIGISRYRPIVYEGVRQT